MKIYTGKNRSKARLSSFAKVLIIIVSKVYEVEEGGSDEINWIGIKINTKKPSEVTIWFHFDLDWNFEDINVWESPIKTIVDDDNMKRIA